MNTEKICRCCLALDVPLLSIYKGGSAGMGCMADMLKQITKLKPQPSDKMPEKACLQCISEINRCYVFKMKCENSNRTLRQLLPDAVPEPLDVVPKKVLVVSSAVQTEDKILISSMVQTVAEEKPLVSHSSAQTVPEEKPFVNHKEIQTEYEITATDGSSQGKCNENFISENIIIYEEIETPTVNIKKRTQSSPLNKQLNKKMCLEKRKTDNLITVDGSESTAQQASAYILFNDSIVDSNSSEEAEIYISSTDEKQKDFESNTFEYYENEVEEIQDDQQQNQIYQENEYVYSENFSKKLNNDIDSSEGITKSPKESTASTKSKKSTVCTRASSKPKGQYKCTQCIMTFVSVNVLKRHLANKHDIKDDDLVIEFLPAAETDKTSQGDEDPSSSDNMAKLSTSKVELTPENVAKPQLEPREKVTSLVNKELFINIKYFCDYCQAGFAQRRTLTYHMKHRVCMTNNFKCNKCDRIFVSEENLETHILTHENPHKCLDCDTVCKTIEELSKHLIDNHNRSARNQCHVCKKVFTIKTSLKNHLRIHSGEKPFICTICGKSFRQNANLRQHLIRHTNEKKFKCDTCPNAYLTKSELFSHKRTHTGEHPFKCNVCQARFTTSCSLQKHIRKHTGERPYACEFCPMRFAALNVLKNHRRIHTGEKPFKCGYCPKSFAQNGDRLTHERSHIHKDFKCFCDSKFSKKSNFRHHIKTQHPDFNEKEIKALLDKSIGDNDNTEYHITLIENTDEKFVNSLDGDTENEGDAFVTISQRNDAKNDLGSNTASNTNEELLEIVMEDVG